MSEQELAIEVPTEDPQQPQIVDPQGRPARRQQVGQPCVNCGEARVKPTMGGGCVYMKCGYQE